MLVESVRLVSPAMGKFLRFGAQGQNILCGKISLVASRQGFSDFSQPSCLKVTALGANVMFSRNLSTHRLTKNMALLTNTPRPLPAKVGKMDSALPLALERPSGGLMTSLEDQRPLCIIMGWLMAKKKHIRKYAQFYLDQGFDVLTVSCSPLQLLFPANGGRLIAKELLTFMANNPQYSSKMLHGFSISGFVWGQVMAMMAEDQEKYQHVINTMVGQIWDSPVDVEGISQGMGTALFPNNWLLKTSLEAYVRFHVNYFQEAATQHYLQSSVLYHNSIVKCPALFFCSEDDPVAFYYIIERVADRWERNGMEVWIKSWKSSPHVSHMWRYPDEYRAEMKAFLDKVGLLKYPDKFLVKSVEAGTGTQTRKR